jgi:hypothetical protein
VLLNNPINSISQEVGILRAVHALPINGSKTHKVWFAEEIYVGLATYLAAHKPKPTQLTLALF